MSIASAIQLKQQQVADSYTAVSNKGGTLPATQNLTNLATAISSIPSGGGSFIGIPREIKNGVYQRPTESFTFSLPNSTTDLGYQALCQAFSNSSGIIGADLSSLVSISNGTGLASAFQNCPNLVNVDISSLQSVSGSSGMSNCFRGCSSLTSLSFDSLKILSGNNAANYLVQDCTSLTSILFPELTTLSGSNCLYYGFYRCSSLVSISFPKLEVLSGGSALYYSCQGCSSLSSISFPSLKTTSFGSDKNQFGGMFNSSSGSTSGAITMHFPSNLQSTISGLTGYPNFGSTAGRLTLAFDLPATS